MVRQKFAKGEDLELQFECASVDLMTDLVHELISLWRASFDVGLLGTRRAAPFDC